MEDKTTKNNFIKEIKHQFMTYRNGIVSDALRKAGMPYDVIFGLQIPDISKIARGVKSENSEEQQYAIAEYLWEERKIRESRLLACWMYPTEMVDTDKAIELASDVMTREEADILCFRLLRNLPYATELLPTLESNESPLISYCATALRRNLE
ncbi:MAG: DNA alkylation repair protein [Muribaculaceae bacterium]